jgi:fumarate reductase subunit D
MPGPLRFVEPNGRRPPDELDEAIDELFGDTTDERPGAFDLGLIVGGIGLTAWSLLGDGGGFTAVVGVVLLMLGVALPARAVVRAVRRRRGVRRRRRAVATGYPLDASGSTNAALVDAYTALVAALARPDVGVGADALDAAHLAMVESATLLDGASPSAPSEIDYVRRRTEAIRALTADLLAADRDRQDREATAAAGVTDARLDRAAALISARDELESVDRLGSLDRLQGLRAALEPEIDDARR